MTIVVKTRIVKIGNSRGIRIPKLLLDQVDLGTEVELAVQQNRIVIRPAYRARHSWEQAFMAMAEQGDDRMFEGDVLLPTVWDESEWEW